jgi:hypothetical protein
MTLGFKPNSLKEDLERLKHVILFKPLAESNIESSE